jgi:hypothetical protein
MPTLRSALALTVTAAAAVLVPAGAATAAPVPEPSVTDSLPARSALGAVHSATAYGVGPVKHLTLDPLANSGVDPLDNAVRPQVADFKPVSTAAVTGPVTRGGSLSTLPLTAQATTLLPG